MQLDACTRVTELSLLHIDYMDTGKTYWLTDELM